MRRKNGTNPFLLSHTRPHPEFCAAPVRWRKEAETLTICRSQHPARCFCGTRRMQLLFAWCRQSSVHNFLGVLLVLCIWFSELVVLLLLPKYRCFSLKRMSEQNTDARVSECLLCNGFRYTNFRELSLFSLWMFLSFTCQVLSYAAFTKHKSL